ncbi:LytR/AlgR family response regulator transcription factor [Hymenobacter ruricola]|uniref:Response regulator transcription factor n=1 Tax=Hymenobacter ruricola TaxID=2791023 RepID=A0ABS0I6K6_9BACT|nr:LytTR family DNA-binding domain-containing protein [Hymenobacter ruricola]MBF9222601.1 response regulator transcription factor [Hymenobacter ruricola]
MAADVPVGPATLPPPLTCAVLDDELLPRLAVVKALRPYAGLTCVGAFANVPALQAALPVPPDVLFLDIEVGPDSGLAYYKSLPAPPLAVFITSHPEYALESIEAAAFDYVLKPLTDERFARVAQRLLDYQALRHKAALFELHLGAEFLTIREGYELSRVPVSDILYLEALDNYTRIYTTERRYLTLVTLKSLCEQLPAHRFLRVHRTYAVAVSKISRLSGGELLLAGGRPLPVGRTYRQRVADTLRQASARS